MIDHRKKTLHFISVAKLHIHSNKAFGLLEKKQT